MSQLDALFQMYGVPAIVQGQGEPVTINIPGQPSVTFDCIVERRPVQQVETFGNNRLSKAAETPEAWVFIPCDPDGVTGLASAPPVGQGWRMTLTFVDGTTAPRAITEILSSEPGGWTVRVK